MTPSFSLYLDLIRFCAALAVFIAHLSTYPISQQVLWSRFASYGDIAVTLFFVLSGYVIAYVTATREKTAKDYFSARASRLYSVVTIALLLTFVFDFIGMQFNPEFYQIQKVLWKPESWAGYSASAIFVNEFQVFHFNGISPGTNGPYWSLSFEAAYYLLAGFVLFSPRIIWIPACLFLLGLAGKTIIALLPIWGLGFLLYHVGYKLNLAFKPAIFLAIVSALSIFAAPTIANHLFNNNNFGVWLPWGRGPFNRNIMLDYFTAAIFAVHLVSVRSIFTTRCNAHQTLQSALRWLGSLTFPLYCMHYPSICMFAAISIWPKNSITHIVFVSIFTFATVILLTPICEHIKHVLRKFLIGM